MLVNVVGTTASGKSELALRLARALPTVTGAQGAEVISTDAFALYRGMDIGTAKVLPDQREDVPHHQIDVLDLTQTASVAAYQKHARADWDAIVARHNQPIAVGGSGLYVAALVDQLDFPGTDEALRAHYQHMAQVVGSPALHLLLEKYDPVSAARIHPANERRIVRALEVIGLTGKPFSAFLPRSQYWRPTLTVGLRWPAEVLRERIWRRSQAMIEGGLIEEVQGLLAAGLEENRTARKATGYAQVRRYLAGELTEAETIEQIATATYQLASAQRKWFGRDQRIHWLDGQAQSGETNTATLLDHWASQVCALVEQVSCGAPE